MASPAPHDWYATFNFGDSADDSADDSAYDASNSGGGNTSDSSSYMSDTSSDDESGRSLRSSSGMSVVGDLIDYEGIEGSWAGLDASDATLWDLVPPSPMSDGNTSDGSTSASEATDVEMPMFRATTNPMAKGLVSEPQVKCEKAPIAWRRAEPMVGRAQDDPELEPHGVDLAAGMDQGLLQQLPPLAPAQRPQPHFLDSIMLLPNLDVPEDDEETDVDQAEGSIVTQTSAAEKQAGHAGAPAAAAVPSDRRLPPQDTCHPCPTDTNPDGADESDASDDRVCPFCQSIGPDSDREGKKTRMRRKRDVPRRKQRFGRWWRMLGYDGPPYCQRCSEVFRDHLMRQTPNSAQCSRANPCDDCSRVLTHFTTSSYDELWGRIDARSQANKEKQTGKRRLPAICKVEPGTGGGDSSTENFSMPAVVRAEQNIKRACPSGARSSSPRAAAVTMAALAVVAIVSVTSYGATNGPVATTDAPVDASAAASNSAGGTVAPNRCAYHSWSDDPDAPPAGYVEVGEYCPIIASPYTEDEIPAWCGDVMNRFQAAGSFCAPGTEPVLKVCKPDGSWDLPLFGVDQRGCTSCEVAQTVPMPAWSAGGTANCQACSKCGDGQLVLTPCSALSDTVCSPWEAVLQKGKLDHIVPCAVAGATKVDGTCIQRDVPAAREYEATWVMRNSSKDTLYLFGGLGPPDTGSLVDHIVNPAGGINDPRTIVSDAEGYRGDMWKGVYDRTNTLVGEDHGTIMWQQITIKPMIDGLWPYFRSHAMAFQAPNYEDEIVPYMFGGFMLSPASQTSFLSGIFPSHDHDGFGSNDLWRFVPKTEVWVKLGGSAHTRLGVGVSPEDKPTISNIVAAQRDAVAQSWPLPRGQGQLLVSCDPDDPALDAATTCAGWLFGGSVGLDTYRLSAADRSKAASSIHLAIPDPAPAVVGVPMNDLWYVNAPGLGFEIDSATIDDFPLPGIFHYHGPASQTYVNDIGTPLITSRFNHPRSHIDAATGKQLAQGTLWPAARAGHASWLGAKGAKMTIIGMDMPPLYVFGGVGASPFGNTESNEVLKNEQHDCLVMQDLWRYDPALANEDNKWLPGGCADALAPGCGGDWVQLSNGPEGIDRSLAPLLDAGAAACRASLLAQAPWVDDWHETSEPVFATVAKSGQPVAGYGAASDAAPIARAHATAWSAMGQMWLFGGQYFHGSADGQQHAPVLDDLWSLDIDGDTVTWHREARAGSAATEADTGAGADTRIAAEPVGRTSATVFTLSNGPSIIGAGQGWEGWNGGKTAAVGLTDAWLLDPEAL